MSNILDPDQAQHLDGPDLDINCLQRLSADDKRCHRQVKSSDFYSILDLKKNADRLHAICIRLKIRHKTVFVYFTYSLNGCAWFLPF